MAIATYLGKRQVLLTCTPFGSLAEFSDSYEHFSKFSSLRTADEPVELFRPFIVNRRGMD